MALGAARSSVLGQVIVQGAWVTVAGLAMGLVMAWWSTRAMSRLLFDVEARDPATFLAAPAALALVAFLACLIPAVRATRIDPAAALRGD
jgi:ABC-type antimicrobial peptide transport system permease subunit